MATKPKTTTVKKAKKAAAKTAFKISKEPYAVAVPKNFSFVTYKPLKKKNFTTEALYFEHRAAQAEHQVKVFKDKAEESRTLGSTKERRQKKQVVKLANKMEELKATLTSQGVDVEAILKAAAAERKAEKKAG